MSLQPLHLAVEAQAQLTPHHACLHDSKYRWTYKQTIEAINTLSWHLQQAGVKKGDVVALFCNKTIFYPLAFLAVAKCGAINLQLDMAFPDALIADVIEEAQAKFVIHDNDLSASCLQQLNSIDIGAINFQDQQQPAKVEVTLDTPVWQAYSSGTTGKPKGLTITHRAMVSSYQWRFAIADYCTSDRVGCSIYLLWEVFRPLLRGACAFIISDAHLRDVQQLLQTIKKEQLSEILFTPSFAETLVNCYGEELNRFAQSLKRLWLNGEVVTTHLCQQLQTYLPQTAIFNLYSISETHDVAALRYAQQNDAVMPVGKALTDVCAVVLDDQLQPCAQNQIGELYIGGDGLAQGYINRPQLNKLRFLKPEQTCLKKRLYKTGDRAVIDENGIITILERFDYIVKLRGYTVSIPAIESALKSLLAINQCAVKVDGEQASEKRLVAYVQAQDRNQAEQVWQIDPQTGVSRYLHDLLLTKLAHYMVPSCFVLIDEIATNRYSAKLDCASLPPPPAPCLVTLNTQAWQQNTISIKQLQTLYAHVLHLPLCLINTDDDFFNLGGSSLQSIQWVKLFNDMSNKKLSIADFINQQPLNRLQAYLNNAIKNNDIMAECQHDSQYQFHAVNTPHCQSLKNCQTLLVTGSTGFIGSFLLAELSQQTQAQLICLVRANDNAEAKRRLFAILQKRGIDTNNLSQIIVIAADLSQPHFGLAQAVYTKLCQQVDAVIHGAAEVNLLYAYQALYASNVLGTKHILDFCGEVQLKPLYYLSTNGIFPLRAEEYPESARIDAYLEQLDCGYAQSKWVAEKCVWQAQTAGLPVMIFRPGNVGMHSQTGAYNAQDFNSLLLREFHLQQTIPYNIELEFTPADHLISLMIQAMLNKPIAAQVFNLTNPKRISATDLQAILPNYKLIDNEQWLKHIKQPSLAALLHSPADLLVPMRFIQKYYKVAKHHDLAKWADAVSKTQ